MEKNNLVYIINSGSSSIKIMIFSMPSKQKKYKCCINAINLNKCYYEHVYYDYANKKKYKIEKKLSNYDHKKGLQFIFEMLKEYNLAPNENSIFGHRFVNGGKYFTKSIIYNEKLNEKLEELEQFAPLHNPISFKILKIIKNIFPKSFNVLSFDTSFHNTLPMEHFIFPIPYEYYEKYGIRRYGAHGLSYNYVLEAMKKIFNRDKLNLIVAHVGSGTSVCAIKNDKSLDTTMGLTPLGGVMMGTRSGDLDPSIISMMMKKNKNNIDEIIDVLNNDSGLKGISQFSEGSNFQYLLKKAAQGHEHSQLALSMFIKQIIDAIAKYYFLLNGHIDAIILTGGIGENSIHFRKIVFNLIAKVINVPLDEEQFNITKKNFIILNKDNNLPLFSIVRTFEESIILKNTYELFLNNLENN